MWWQAAWSASLMRTPHDHGNLPPAANQIWRGLLRQEGSNGLAHSHRYRGRPLVAGLWAWQVWSQQTTGTDQISPVR